MDYYEKGLETILRVDCQEGIEKTQSLGDLGYYTIAHGWGEIYNRPNMGDRDRELCIVSFLLAKGACSGPLRSHMELAMNCGVTREELIELIIQGSFYCGMPNAVAAYHALSDLCKDKDMPL